MLTDINLQRFSDGTFINWGRHWRLFSKDGTGPARWYTGEAAEVMALVIKYSSGVEE